jgi:electron transfer flavoprotein alpha subunit
MKMNNVFVYCELTETGMVSDVSLELLSKGRKLAEQLGVRLEAVLLGVQLDNAIKQLSCYNIYRIHYADDARLFPYRTLPHANLVRTVFEKEQPEIALFGATNIGRDLAPNIASALRCGLTADCTSLEIGDYEEKKTGKIYKNLLYQIRPAFGGNIIATIINPDTRPQMATVREGVMKLDPMPTHNVPLIEKIVPTALSPIEEAVRIINRHIDQPKVNLKTAQIIVAGGYGMGNQDNFNTLHLLADVLGGEVGATRAAVDAGFCGTERQIGQTGVTVRPKLYIACGISGSIQHRAGMDKSAKIISINTDIHAPMNTIANYIITGDVMQVIPKLIKAYKQKTR